MNWNSNRGHRMLILLALLIVVPDVVAQYGSATHKPVKITDTVPAGPPDISRQDGYHKIYHNKDGVVYKDERYVSERGPHVSTRYVDEIYPNTGKAAKDIIVTGSRDAATGIVEKVSKQEEIYYDEQGNRVKVETYTNFNRDDVAQRKQVVTDGVTSNYVRDSTTNEWVLEGDATKPKKTGTGIGSLSGIGPLTNKSKKGCLYGTWRSEDFNIAGTTGGDGIMMTINEDDSVTIDYDSMVQVREVNQYTSQLSWTLKHRGKGTGQISVSGRLITIVKNGETDIVTVSEMYFYNPPNVDAERSVKKGLGPVFLGYGKDDSTVAYPASYECKENGLQIIGPRRSTSFQRVK